MQRYIRLAGIDEAGATIEAVLEKVVSLYDHRKKDWNVGRSIVEKQKTGLHPLERL